jgi:hypothetical protein
MKNWDNFLLSNKSRQEKWEKSTNRFRTLLLIGLFCLFILHSVVFSVSLAQGASFIDSGQSLGTSKSQTVTFGDLDGDNDLDAFVANDGGNKVWLNDGNGNFIDSGQSLGTSYSGVAALGDLDGDNDLDAFVANGDWYASGQANKVWLNDGNGNFSDSGQSLGGTSGSQDVALGDLDGDNDLDAFVANYVGPNKIWLNDGNGNFSGGQDLSDKASEGVALGDLDGDNDLDAFIANFYGQANDVWLNDGNGNFIDSGQSLGTSNSWDVVLGDLDGDNDLDAFVANSDANGGANKVWLNDGNGNFSDSGQSLGTSDSWELALGDLDGDNDLDAFIANGKYQGNKVWLNDGNGNFSDSGQSLGTSFSEGVALGDVDGDNDLDAFVANRAANKVFLYADSLTVSYDATGTWSYSTSNNWVDPGPLGTCDANADESGTSTVTQAGNSVTIVVDGTTYNGNVVDANYTASASYPDSGGTVTETLTFTLSSSTSGSGTVTWFWTDGLDSCNAGSDISLAKQSGGGGGGGGGG